MNILATMKTDLSDELATVRAVIAETGAPVLTEDILTEAASEAAHRSPLWALIQSWETRGDEHERRADAASESGDTVNHNRQDAFAYAARLHARELRQALRRRP